MIKIEKSAITIKVTITQFSPGECLKYALIVFCYVERSFTKYNSMSCDNRRSFQF